MKRGPTPSPNAWVAVRVWDLPTRVFHWLLAGLVVAAIVTAWIGGNAMVWHLRCGLSVLALLVFRLVWGLIGGRWSRFSSFLYAPATLLRYLRGEVRDGEPAEVGHNPLGGLSVFALLGLLAVQVATGLVADDEIATTGPLNRFVSNDRAQAATAWHHGAGQWLLLTLLGLHLLSILYYRLRLGKDLLGPMLSGDKRLPADTPSSRDNPSTRGLALLLALVCAALAVWIDRLDA